MAVVVVVVVVVVAATFFKKGKTKRALHIQMKPVSVFVSSRWARPSQQGNLISFINIERDTTES